MAQYLQSVAYTRLFFMVQSADHLSAATGLTPAVNVSKAGAAFSAIAGAIAEVSGGWYTANLTTGDTGTAGDLAFHITAAGADNTDFVDQIGVAVAANVTQWNGTNVGNATAGVPDVNVKNINNVVAATPGAAGGILISGSNAGTTTFGNVTITGNITGSIVGSLSGSVGSVTGAVGSVTGNVGGNVTGTVGNVTGTASVNVTQVNGNVTSATSLAKTTQAIGRGTVTTGASTTSVPTSALTPAGASTVANQFANRTILFDPNTTTAGLQGASASISASTSGATPILTVGTLPATPVSGDTFSVV